MEKTLWTGNDDGETVAHIEALDEREEVRTITDLFKSILDRKRGLPIRI